MEKLLKDLMGESTKLQPLNNHHKGIHEKKKLQK